MTDEEIYSCGKCEDKLIVDCPMCDGSCIISKKQGRKLVEKNCPMCVEISGKIDCPVCVSAPTTGKKKRL